MGLMVNGHEAIKAMTAAVITDVNARGSFIFHWVRKIKKKLSTEALKVKDGPASRNKN